MMYYNNNKKKKESREMRNDLRRIAENDENENIVSK